jgi:AraC-like DNA-binding protein
MNMVMTCHDFRVRKALQIIDREPGQTVSRLAMQLRISKSRFSHLFKTQTGVSFKSYILRRRLEQAGFLLLNSRMEIKEIAYCLGYRHGPSFARAFKAQFGSTPNRYRQAKGAVHRKRGNALADDVDKSEWLFESEVPLV